MNLSEMFQRAMATVFPVGTFGRYAETATYSDGGAVVVGNRIQAAGNLPVQEWAIKRTLGKATPLLEQDSTLFERTDAIRIALGRGIPLYEIEDYLDWLDMVPPTDLPRERPEDNEDDFRRVA